MNKLGIALFGASLIAVSPMGMAFSNGHQQQDQEQTQDQMAKDGSHTMPDGSKMDGHMMPDGSMMMMEEVIEVAPPVSDETLVVQMTDLETGKPAGTITITDSDYGLVFTPNLMGVTPGLHGFHVHTNPSCEPSMSNGKKVLGGAAGGHYDPEKTGKHGYPWTNDNHLGDLPSVYIASTGKGTSPVLAPRLEMDNVKNRSLMIHVGGDNYSDTPKPLGGGGARMVCGVIPAESMTMSMGDMPAKK